MYWTLRIHNVYGRSRTVGLNLLCYVSQHKYMYLCLHKYMYVPEATTMCSLFVSET